MRNGMLAGLRQVSFWLMKHRARTVGEQGMFQFVNALQQASDAHIHLMGHSFGCIVISSILGGPGGTARLPERSTRPSSCRARCRCGRTPRRFPALTSPATSVTCSRSAP